MTPREEAAFRLGIAHAAEQALIAAIALEIRPDAMEMRQRAAIEALRGLADGLRGAESTTAVDLPVEGFHDLPVKKVPPSREQAAAVGDTGDADPSG